MRGAKYCAHCGRFLSELEDAADLRTPLPPGTLIGNYRLRGLLGEGGMGRVYVAEHVKLGRLVALKMLRPELVANPASVARFFAEARAVNQISHENIVEITDFVEQPGGDNCLILELLRGEDLGQRLARKRVLPLARALDIASQVASALSAVHAAGIVHRDLKPDNIFLIERGGSGDFVKLLDFGVAKLSDPSGAGGIAMHSTAAGQIIGTPEYMSPEQASGQPIDHRTDIYSLGVIFYEMVTGALPFSAKSFGELLLKHMTAPIALPARDPAMPTAAAAARDRLLHDLLAKEPNDRPHTMDVVERRIGDVMDALGLPRRSKRRASTGGAEPTGAESRTPTPPSPSKTSTPPSEKRRTPPPDRPVAIARTATPVGAEAVARVKLATRGDVAAQAVEAQRPRVGERIAKASSEDVERRLAKASTECAPLERPSAELRLAKASAESAPPDKPRANRRDDFETPVTGEKKVPRARTEPPVDTRNSVGRSTGPAAAIVEIDRRREQRSDDDRVARPDSSNERIPKQRGDSDADRRARSPAKEGDGSGNERRSDDRNASLRTEDAGRHDIVAKRAVTRDVQIATGGDAPRTPETIREAPRIASEPGAGPAAAAQAARSAGRSPTRDKPAAAPAVRSPTRDRPAGVYPPAPRGRPIAPWVAAGATLVALGAVVWIVIHRDDSPAPRMAPSAVPAPPAEVRIKFVSAPAGASVRVAGTHEQVCVTPCTKTFPRGELAIAFELDKDGYATATETANLASNDAIAVALVPASPAAGSAADAATTSAMSSPSSPSPSSPSPSSLSSQSAKPAPPVDRDGTMTVFPK